MFRVIKIDHKGMKKAWTVYMTSSERIFLKRKAKEFSDIMGNKVTFSKAIRILIFGKEKE